MTSSPTHHLAPTDLPQGALRTIGSVLCRMVIPGWVLAGATYKLVEMNPKLLPPVVLSVLETVAGNLKLPVTDVYDPALRLIVTAEIALVLIMIFAARISRVVAVGLMFFFCAILVQILLSKGASCGCFGKAGPPPWVMLVIDGALLLGALLIPNRRSTMRCVPTLMTIVGSTMVGAGVAFMAPGLNAIEIPDRLPADGTPTDVLPPPVDPTPPAVTNGASETRAWPPMPKQIQPYYNFEPEKWLGTPLDSQPMALLMTNLSVNPNSGRWHLIFIREDCDHCHHLLEKYFIGPLKTPAITVVVPDATGAPMENPCTECAKTALVRVGNAPMYLITTPVLMTIQDGKVISICADTEDAEQVRQTLNAK
jgi:hypothetical protein